MADEASRRFAAAQTNALPKEEVMADFRAGRSCALRSRCRELCQVRSPTHAGPQSRRLLQIPRLSTLAMLFRLQFSEDPFLKLVPEKSTRLAASKIRGR